ncbi:hypothetical protein [Desulfonatronum thioautotrophicum]|uniref:hypothetical protein n=1 Tax=Desulfonatronum thioautotrophicum TaxID=617001 RepID=UPI0005EB8F07|nr:hypothetical protein [Desulfonatronum thioautotrophicum]
MHFRERQNVIQIIRTVYDPGKKRGRQKLVGSIPKKDLKVPEDVLKNCSEEELLEIEKRIERFRAFQDFELAYIAKKLPLNLSMAEEWFRANAGSDEARDLAEELAGRIRQFKVFLKKQGLLT